MNVSFIKCLLISDVKLLVEDKVIKILVQKHKCVTLPYFK